MLYSQLSACHSYPLPSHPSTPAGVKFISQRYHFNPPLQPTVSYFHHMVYFYHTAGNIALPISRNCQNDPALSCLVLFLLACTLFLPQQCHSDSFPPLPNYHQCYIFTAAVSSSLNLCTQSCCQRRQDQGGHRTNRG